MVSFSWVCPRCGQVSLLSSAHGKDSFVLPRQLHASLLGGKGTRPHHSTWKEKRAQTLRDKMFGWKKGLRQERKSNANKDGMFTYVWEPLPWKVESRRNRRPRKARREGTDVISDLETREGGAGCRPRGQVV